MQVVKGSDCGETPDSDVASADSDVPVETHVNNPPQVQTVHERTKEYPRDKKSAVIRLHLYVVQEIEGNDAGRDPDVDGVPTDSDEMVATRVSKPLYVYIE